MPPQAARPLVLRVQPVPLSGRGFGETSENRSKDAKTECAGEGGFRTGLRRCREGADLTAVVEGRYVVTLLSARRVARFRGKPERFVQNGIDLVCRQAPFFEENVTQ